MQVTKIFVLNVKWKWVPMILAFEETLVLWEFGSHINTWMYPNTVWFFEGELFNWESKCE